METAQINAAIEKLGRAFEDFKTTNDARLKAVESKGAGGADRDEKLEKLSKAMDEQIETVKKLQVVANRPQVGEEEEKAKKERSEAKSKFELFLRKGKGGAT